MNELKRFPSTLYSFLFFAIITFIHNVTSTATGCRANRFREVIGHEKDDYLIYGITQDCQLFFVRSYQLDYLNSIQVDPRNGYCSPGVVQLHISSASTILLLMRQGPSRLCTLELSIPPPEIIFGTHLFKFSVVTSLRFMVCSHAQDFHLNPAQTFLDTAFQDVIYAIDGESTGSQWMAKQLVIRNGTLRLLGSVLFDRYPTDPKGDDVKTEAKEFVLGRDSARKSLTIIDQHTREYTKSCLFDLLFRPHAVKVEHGKIENPFGGGATLHSVSTEGKIFVIGEEKRASQYITSTFVYAMNSTSSSRMSCIAQMDFAAEVGVIRISTLKQMRDEPLPKFSPHKKKDFHRRISEEFEDEKMEVKEKERDREMNRVIGDEIRGDADADQMRGDAEKMTTKTILHQMEDQKESGDQFSVETVDHNKDDEEMGEMKEREEHKNERHHHQKHDHPTTNAEDLNRNPEKPTGIPVTDSHQNSLPGSPTNDTLTSSFPSLSILFSCASTTFSAFLVIFLN
ncbi:unnamed protein product, partial [Mesorhabditis belari]|uniref:Uncharacterized protein n=1 Tax=Mesorhabditis belari TaxID=2138241 RepID=A0AAF3FHP6_9BILA